MMLVMRFLMSLGCRWCFCSFTGSPPRPHSFDLKTSPGLVGLREAPELAEPGTAVTCETQSRCSPEHHGVLRRWPVVSLEAAGQASGWDGAEKPSWEWDLHLQWDTGWVCEVSSNSNTNNSSTNNSNIKEQTPLWCKVFYRISVQGHAWSKLISPEIPFVLQKVLLLRVREWKLPCNLSVCPGLLHTTSQVHIWIAVSCWGFS